MSFFDLIWQSLFPSLLLALAPLADALVVWQQGARRHEIAARLALAGFRPADLLLALVLALAGWAGTAVALALLPPEARDALRAALFPGWRPDSAAALLGLRATTALAEELFFRGWLAGLLVRTLGRERGLAAQALASLVPLLPLLLLGPALLPLLAAQAGLAWGLGWLRWRSGSILPGGVARLAAGVLSFEF
ncbi:MAG TPA: CPBP family glutamic-type intramembrane protease [Roseiflexaceae bacterium]|nr:CPBP family glutamic-type intramembrane protease [Roseiflexaceae bacterium]